MPRTEESNQHIREEQKEEIFRRLIEEALSSSLAS